MTCPCKHKENQTMPSRTRENRQAPSPLKKVGMIRRLRREIK